MIGPEFEAHRARRAWEDVSAGRYPVDEAKRARRMRAREQWLPGGYERVVADLQAAYVARMAALVAPVEPRSPYSKAYLMAASFPTTLEKWLAEVDEQNGLLDTRLQVLRSVADAGVAECSWTAPPGYGAGDVVFFYGSKSAVGYIRAVRRAARGAGLADADTLEFFESALDDAVACAGQIVAYGILEGHTEPGEPGPGGSWQSRRYAPLAEVVWLTQPMNFSALPSVVPRPHTPCLPLAPDAFAALKTEIRRRGETRTPAFRTARPGSVDTVGLSRRTWRSIACRNRQQFHIEAELRRVFVNYLLEDIKDPRTQVHREVSVVGTPGRGIPDYLVRVNGEWIPVEVKLAFPSAPKLLAQVTRHTAGGAFVARTSNGRRIELLAATAEWAAGVALVIDQAGLSVVRDGRFLAGEPKAPWWPRTALRRRTGRGLRRELVGLLRA